MVNFHNKNQKKKLVVKGKRIVTKFNGKCFICNKTEHPAKDCKIGSKQGTLKRKGFIKPILPRLIIL
jgi:hypothetical protein